MNLWNVNKLESAFSNGFFELKFKCMILACEPVKCEPIWFGLLKWFPWNEIWVSNFGLWTREMWTSFIQTSQMASPRLSFSLKCWLVNLWIVNQFESAFLNILHRSDCSFQFWHVNLWNVNQSESAFPICFLRSNFCL